jgi:sporadic carbohydrate cluster protein (TIGR04323 family)
MNHLPTLWHIVETRKCNLVMYSIFALSEDEKERARFFDIVLANGIFIHFANEDLQIATRDDVDMVESYLKFAKFGHSRMPIGLPLSQHSKTMFTHWTA